MGADEEGAPAAQKNRILQPEIIYAAREDFIAMPKQKQISPVYYS
jgi:hypothetical protein